MKRQIAKLLLIVLLASLLLSLPLTAEATDMEKIVDIAVLNKATIVVRADGRVEVYGDNEHGFDLSEMSKWRDIVAVSAVNSHVEGLKRDGTLLSVGYDYKEVFNQEDKTQWKNIKRVVASCAPMSSGTFAILDDDTLISTMKPNHPYYMYLREVKDFSSSGYINVCLLKDGTVIVTGENTLKKTIESWKNLEQVLAVQQTAFGLTKDGKVLAEPASEAFKETVDWCDIKELLCAVSLLDGKGFVAALKSDGSVVTCGDDSYEMQYDFKRLQDWKDIVKIAANSDHAVGLKSDGTVVACGNYDRGQCKITGHMSS